MAWKNAIAACEKAGKDLAGGAAPATVVEGLAGKLGKLSGLLPKRLAERLQAAGGDATALARVLSEAPKLPARWLATDFLKL